MASKKSSAKKLGTSSAIERPPVLQIDSFAHTLIDTTQFYERNLDENLRVALQAICSGLNLDFIACRYGPTGNTIFFVEQFAKDSELTGALKSYLDHDQAEQDIEQVQWVTINKTQGILAPCKTKEVTERSQPTGVTLNNYTLFGTFDSESNSEMLSRYIDSGSDSPDSPDSNDILSKNGYSFLTLSRLICSIFRQRSYLYSRFPRSFSDAYWYHAGHKSQSAGEEKNQTAWAPPWNSSRRSSGELTTEGGVPGRRSTVTLSFDLRRSTRAMDRMLDPKAFADWIEAMVIILRRIAIENNGVFDKFTGDGVLVHFLEDECKAFDLKRPGMTGFDPDNSDKNDWRTSDSNGGHYAAADAIACAFEMVQAIDAHAKILEGIARKDDLNFGAVAAIAKGLVQWSVNRDGDPIVVGPSVVDACRYTDGAKKGEVRASPHVTYLLKEAGLKLDVKQKEFKSKETGDKDRDAIITHRSAPIGLCRLDYEIECIVKEVQAEIRARAKKHLKG